MIAGLSKGDLLSWALTASFALVILSVGVGVGTSLVVLMVKTALTTGRPR